MTDRITRYSHGNLGLRVAGVEILIRPTEEQADVAAELAARIAALGPPGPPSVATPALAAVPLDPPSSPPASPLPFSVGERVYCTVHGAAGWTTVTEVGQGRNRGRIKILGLRNWCPAGNFSRDERRPTS